MSEEKQQKKAMFPDGGVIYTNDATPPPFIKFPYGVRLQADPESAFQSIRQYEEFVMSGEANIQEVTKRYNALLESSVSQDADGYNVNNISTDGPEVSYFNQPIYTDTRVGCNDAMNPLWQFNRDDDIRPPMLFPPEIAASKTFGNNTDEFKNQAAHSIGMGRVYAENYEANQQILWLEAGVPRFTNLLEFYRDAADADVATTVNAGTFQTLTIGVITKLLKGTIWAITLPLTSVFYLSRWTTMLANDRITKYYSFQPAMTMYYETVNAMLQYVAVSMGIHPYAMEQHAVGKGSSFVNGDQIVRAWGLSSTNVTDTKNTGVRIPERDENGNITGYRYVNTESVRPDIDGNYPGIPEILRRGPDIFRIMNRRSQMLDMNIANLETRDLAIAEQSQTGPGVNAFIPPIPDAEYKDDTWVQKVGRFLSGSIRQAFGALKGSALGSGNHIGFRIERGLTPSETFSNTTGETGLAQKMNGISMKYKEENETFGNSAAAAFAFKAGQEGITDGFKGVLKAIGLELKDEVLKSVANFSGFDIGAVLLSGNGFLDIPEVWRSSSFEKSYSFNIQLRSRYGDPVSIFQSIYIPMLMLMALAAPRAIGTNMYTSPFLVRGFCRGMISIPLGLVTGMTIRRGRDEFGWTSDFLPTAVDIDLTIKDLSPSLFLSMQDNGVFDTFSRNTNLLEYLDTLAGLGLKEKIFFFPKFMRKLRTTLAIARTTVFSTTYWGTRIGRSNAARVWFNSFVPFKNDRTPEN